MAARKLNHIKNAGGSTLHTADNAHETKRFMAYIDGKLKPLPHIGKPVLVHIKGRQAPFDPNLEPYFDMQRKLRRAK